MAKIVFKEGQVLFAGGYPDHVPQAKAYIEKHGYSKADVRMYKKTEEYQPINGSTAVKVETVLVETLRPIAIDCGVIGCPNHTEKDDKNGD